MSLPNSGIGLSLAVSQIQSTAGGLRGRASGALATLQGGPVNSDWVFNFLDACIANIATLDKYKTVSGLDAFAQAQIPGYVGTITADVATTRAAIVACINWVVTNFPKDSTASFVLSHTLNADGTRSPRSFSSAQTAGLQTALQALIATISA